MNQLKLARWKPGAENMSTAGTVAAASVTPSLTHVRILTAPPNLAFLVMNMQDNVIKLSITTQNCEI